MKKYCLFGYNTKALFSDMKGFVDTTAADYGIVRRFRKHKNLRKLK
jgi:hypothetical protein